MIMILKKYKLTLQYINYQTLIFREMLCYTFNLYGMFRNVGKTYYCLFLNWFLFHKALRCIFTVSGFIPQIDSLPRTVRCYKRIEFRQGVFSEYTDTRYGRHSYIIANWAGNDGDIDRAYGSRPGRIQHIFVYKFIAGNGIAYSLALARVDW